jgi:sugar-specific transcriptional regulator TrmB
VLVADKLEAMLHGESGGLSAVTIAERSNASYRQVLDLLRELERTGRVRRTGTRRTTLWRLITDEERIAERAAELERRSAKSGS